MSSSSVKTFNCPNCASSVKVRIQGQSLTVVCESCLSLIDTSDENYKVLKKVINKKSQRQAIPLGTRGMIQNILWEVTGYMERKDGEYNWSEYLLFNPMKGYRWLIEYRGHWTFFRGTKGRLISVGDKTLLSFSYENYKFKLFSRGKAEVTHVMGEFYWKVRIGDTVQMFDYICPPYTLSAERDNSEIVWSIGEYLKPEIVKETFGLKEMPYCFGVAPSQPFPVNSFVLKLAFGFLFIIVFLQIAFCYTAPNKLLYQDKLLYTKSDTEKVKVSPSFEITKKDTNLKINFSAPVDNNWIELSVSLVNEGNGETIDREAGIEYYHGVEDGEGWSEGSQYSNILLSSLPAGKYHLNIEASGPLIPNTVPSTPGVPEPQDISISVSVRNGVLIWSNFFWSIFFLSIYPIIVLFRRNSFEVERWSESDYSPH